MRRSSLDQKTFSLVLAFQTQLPVLLSLCASAKCVSFRLIAASACFRSWISMLPPYQPSTCPVLSNKGKARFRNHRYSPSHLLSRPSPPTAFPPSPPPPLCLI